MPPDITPTEEQSEAIDAIEAWYRTSDPDQQTFLLDGGAGVGKTTVAGLALQRLNIKRPLFGAYTAKAARVMTWKGMDGAMTLHRMLYVWNENTKSWIENQHSLVRNSDLIILDECSMVPEKIASDLLKYNKPVLVLGDTEGQLPPIEGHGAFTNRRPDYRLLEIHRTAAESPINRLAWAVRRGAELKAGQMEGGARVQYMRPSHWPQICNRDWQVICGKHKTRMAVTRRARESFGFSGLTPCPGEPLICTRNDYSRGLINGDNAVVWRIREDNINEPMFKADLIIDGEDVEDVPIWRWPFEQHFHSGAAGAPITNRWKAAEFDWAYAITVYKAQGSEYDKVIFIDDKFGVWDKDLRRRLMYTAVSRARDELLVLQTG